MAMIKFLHFADIHLGVENYGRLDTNTGLHSRLNDFIKSLSTAIEIAIEEKVDFALFCGDAYKNNNPSPTNQREFARQIYRLSEASIPTVLINGNHDNPLTYGRASALDIFQTLNIPNIHVVTEPRIINLQTVKGMVQIVGIPWPTKNQYLEKDEYRNSDINTINKKIRNRLLKKIKSLISELNLEYPKILAAHLTIAESVFSGSENYAVIGNDPVVPVQFFLDSVFDYIALGHIHRYQNLNAEGDVPVVYSGSMERINFGEEKEDKGFCIGSIDDRGKTEYEFIPLPIRKMLSIDVDIKDSDNPTSSFLAEIEKHDLKDAIIRIHYNISEGQEEKLDFRKINEGLKDAFLVTGITRNIFRKQGDRRSSLSEKMDIFSALSEYIKINNWQSCEKELREQTYNLQQELKDSNNTMEGNKNDTYQITDV
jgi:DNA repair protein SbcD/Mre11